MKHNSKLIHIEARAVASDERKVNETRLEYTNSVLAAELVAAVRECVDELREIGKQIEMLSRGD